MKEVVSPAQANGAGRVSVGVTHHQIRNTLLALSGRAPGRAARCEIQSSQQIRESAWGSACPGVGRSPLGGQLRVAVSGLPGWPGVGFRRLDGRFGVLSGLDGKGCGRCRSEWQGREQRLGRARRRRCAGYDEPARKRFRSNSRSWCSRSWCSRRSWRHVIEHRDGNLRLGRFRARRDDGLWRLHQGCRPCRLGRGRGPECVGGNREDRCDRKQQSQCQPHDGLLHCRFPEANRTKNPYPSSPGRRLAASKSIRAG
jgi:hypothetical protein